MWLPKNAEEIERFARSGALHETATFDAKKELTKDSREIAKDIAAMANDGGVLLYGIDEDATGRPTLPNPIPLVGESERINNIVQTCISEPPEIRIYSHPTDDNLELGYLVVAVPPSMRAPHMVIVKGDNRYYGRSATGNIPLTEGAIARLYSRREHWDINIQTLLDDQISRSPLADDIDFSYLHALVRPVTSTEELLDTARGKEEPIAFLNNLLRVATTRLNLSDQYSPDFSFDHNWFQQADGWVTYLGDDPRFKAERDPRYVLDIWVDRDGTVRLFCSRAADGSQGSLYVLEGLIAGLTTRLAFMTGVLYERAGYLGPVDMAVAVTNLEGARSILVRNNLRFDAENFLPYDRPIYRRSARFPARTLLDDPQTCSERVVLPLLRTTTQGRHKFSATIKGGASL